MIAKNKVSTYSLYSSLLAFILFAVYILYINQEVLYTAHDRSEFLIGAQFFHTLLSKPFGLIQYAGAWLTQLFYNPAVGSAVLGTIWVLIFLIGVKAFHLSGSACAQMLLPIAFLLTSIVDLGYWIYIFTIRGYFFSQSLGYLLMLLLLWAARCTPRKYHLAWYLIAFGLFPILGWFAILFALCLILSEKPTWRELVGFIILLVTASIWRTLLYSHMKLDDVILAGFPTFVTPSNKSEVLSLPFWLLGVLSIIITLFARYTNKWFVPVLSAIAGIAFSCSLAFQDKNYINEMRMVRHADSGNWHEVLDIAEENSKPTLSMVMLKNVALMHEGGLLEQSFKLGNEGFPIYNPDSLNVSFLEIAAPVTYYNYGLINEGFRLSFECAVQSGFTPFYLRMLSRCAVANEETNLAERYISQLQHNLYYEDWQPEPVPECVKELKQSYNDELTGVENSSSYLVSSISLWHEAESRLSSEQALFYSMLRCDSRRFWDSVRKYIKYHLDEELPTHVQEAYILFYDKAPEEKRMRLPVNQLIYERYKKFWETLENYAMNGLSRDNITEKMRGEFGDTYWYYNILGRKIN